MSVAWRSGRSGRQRAEASRQKVVIAARNQKRVDSDARVQAQIDPISGIRLRPGLVAGAVRMPNVLDD